MARYADEYETRSGERYRRGREGRSAYGGNAARDHYGYYRPADYGADFGHRRGPGDPESGYRGSALYGDEFHRTARPAQLPRKPARGYPVRGIHSYDLDYGSLSGPTTEYSGRMGYPVLQSRPEPDEEYPPRGLYTPNLGEADRGRTLYGGISPEYRARNWRRYRRHRNRPSNW